MTAYYNEHDPFAAAWLRELIKAGHIAEGVVDERSIEDVTRRDLDGFIQCHFFAGIGVWSHSLRRAGWSDDRPVWTGSCPCQPFSAAGKGAGFADERHLWPAFHHRIAQCKPSVVFGEQVASKAVDDWIDLVHADLEALGYAFGSVPFPSAGVGAPHIRDRNFWVAQSASNGCAGRGQSRAIETRPTTGRDAERPPADERRELSAGFKGSGTELLGGLGNNNTGLEGLGRGHQAQGGWFGEAGSVAEAGELGGLAYREGDGHERSGELDQSAGCAGAPHSSTDGGVADTPDSSAGEERILRVGQFGLHQESRRMLGDARNGERCEGLPAATEHTSQTNGFWRDADWLFCRDGKWRPVEPGTFPLAHGAAARVGRLRGYGNAINAEAATAFIEAYMN